MKKWNKLQALALSTIMIVNLTGTAFANQAAGPGAVLGVEEGDIVVLYTNDIHTHVDNDGLRYSNVAALKDDLAREGADVLLVDAGDHIQGTAFGSMDKGETILKLMNAADYDLATFGNHEFDYGMDGAMNAIEWADFPYVSANFYHEDNGVNTGSVLDAYKVFDFGDTEIAFIGITTPETFTKSTPAYFQDGNGNYIYGIASGEDGSELYAAVQKAIDAASKEADIVIGLGHLGVDPSSRPWTSEEVIANTTGLDAFIDGHSHTTIDGKAVKDKDGNDVWLTQTGEYLNAVGKMTIKADGSIATELVTEYKNTDDKVKVMEENWIEQINTELGQVIGSTADTLDNYDANGKRLVRSQETNTGDFAADALYYLFADMGLDVDVAIMNGGGIRNKAVTGNISYLTCKEIHTFGNVACLQTVTGQQILDALEWGARAVGVAESGGFLHVSGLKYTIDTSIPSTVQKDEKDVWIGGPTGAYRVGNVQILNNQTGEYEALDLTAKYNLAGYNYTLRDLGDGFAMFDGAVNVLDYVMEDYMVLANYVGSFADGVVTGYAEPQGRITFGKADAQAAAKAPAQTAAPSTTQAPAASDGAYVVVVGDSLWLIAQNQLGNGNRWKEIYALNQAA
ncbi:MAG: 5'-nucleotidase C-terminal domain-containing protein, partial [Lachnospiraceae bacterium]|nr:5'-nucleotidase C-terminal domain-containing protein [Lachnospiraceae bacterium]